MKIAIIGSKSFDSLEFNLNEAFNKNGHSCKIFDIYDRPFFKIRPLFKYFNQLDWIGRRFINSYDINVFNSMAKKVYEYSPDLVLCVYRFIHPYFVKRMKEHNYKVVQINPDSLTTLEYQQIFASDYDTYFTKDSYMASFMRDKMKLNVKLYNEAFNSRLHLKPSMNKIDCEEGVNTDVLVYGTMYPYRNRMLRALKDNEIVISLYGVKPRFFDPFLDSNFRNSYITGQEKAKLLYGSKVVFNNLHYAEINSVNNKFFEINGSGAFQICDYRPILKELLPIDPELVSFTKIDEATEKIKYYLKHPEERVEISSKIYTHFLDNYTYDHLIKYILNNI